MWEGWEAGILAFHAFHTLSFPWPVFARQCWISRHANVCIGDLRSQNSSPPHPHLPALILFGGLKIG